VLDYARSYDVPTVVFRMSCIYGPRQFGTEDQGWVAHFLISAMAGDPIVIYGDGRQVRDLLFVEDLVDAFCITAKRPRAAMGRAFNIGGGAARAASLLQVLELIERCDVPRPKLRFDEWRTGDQRYYVSNTSSFERATGWNPRVGIADGIRRLHEWLRTSEHPALAHISSVAERSRSVRSASRNGVEVATREVAP